jgi:hypothetical protein
MQTIERGVVLELEQGRSALPKAFLKESEGFVPLTEEGILLGKFYW